MTVKVCGMRDAANISKVALLNPDYMGFIFYASSPRSCLGMEPDLITALPLSVTPVMVTVDMDEDQLLRLADNYGFRTVQLHGGESPELCRSLRSRGLKVIKALGMSIYNDLNEADKYKDTVDLFLFDTACLAKGGSGKKFNWKILDSYNLDMDFWLSGGIGPEDADIIKKFKHPRCAGIDLNSRFESAPGLKDIGLLRTFMEALHS